MTCDCLFTHGKGFCNPYLIDPNCELHGTNGSERCPTCNSLRQPCGCEPNTGLDATDPSDWKTKPHTGAEPNTNKGATDGR